MDQISAITSSAEYCEQFVSYFCKLSRLLNTPGRIKVECRHYHSVVVVILKIIIIITAFTVGLNQLKSKKRDLLRLCNMSCIDVSIWGWGITTLETLSFLWTTSSILTSFWLAYPFLVADQWGYLESPWVFLSLSSSFNVVKTIFLHVSFFLFPDLLWIVFSLLLPPRFCSDWVPFQMPWFSDWEVQCLLLDMHSWALCWHSVVQLLCACLERLTFSDSLDTSCLWKLDPEISRATSCEKQKERGQEVQVLHFPPYLILLLFIY